MTGRTEDTLSLKGAVRAFTTTDASWTELVPARGSQQGPVIVANQGTTSFLVEVSDAIPLSTTDSALVPSAAAAPAWIPVYSTRAIWIRRAAAGNATAVAIIPSDNVSDLTAIP